MITNTGDTGVIRSGNLSAYPDAGYMHIRTGSVSGATAQYVWIFDNTAIPMVYIYISSSKLYFGALGNLKSGTSGRWSCAISANTDYQIAWTYDINADETVNPRVWMGSNGNPGAEQTMTEESTPVALVELTSIGAITVGSWNTSGSSTTFNGSVGELLLWSTPPSDAAMVRATSSGLMGMCTDINRPNQLAYWPLDQAPDGASIVSGSLKDLIGGNDFNNNSQGDGRANSYLSYPFGECA